jgi:hypothetical protein
MPVLMSRFKKKKKHYLNTFKILIVKMSRDTFIYKAYKYIINNMTKSKDQKKNDPFLMYQNGYIHGYLGNDIIHKNNFYYMLGYEEGENDDRFGKPMKHSLISK